MIWAAGMHWSQSAPAWCGFFCPLYRGPVLLRYELTWRGVPPEVAAQDIIRHMIGWSMWPAPGKDAEPPKHQLAYIAAQPALWPKDEDNPGITVSETFSLAGLPMLKGNDDRINGWSRFRSWLAVRDWEYPPGEHFKSPSLIIHPSCTKLLRTLPTLVEDPSNTDDVHKGPEEIPANGVRYYAMSRPMPSVAPVPELPPDAIGRELQRIRAELEAAAL